jgi:F-type H+-transporting ATPase subunit a
VLNRKEIIKKKMLYKTNTNLIINSPLEQFEVTSLLGLNAPIFGHLNITLTNLGFYSLLVLFLIIGIHYMGNNETKLLPNKWSIGLESIFASVNAMVREQLGKEIYLPFIYSLFFFIFNS